MADGSRLVVFNRRSWTPKADNSQRVIAPNQPGRHPYQCSKELFVDLPSEMLGILNVTPDSFSVGGQLTDLAGQ